MANYLIGIDGGGSKTDFLLCDLDFNEVGRRIASRSNPFDIGIDSVEDLIAENIEALLIENNVDKTEVVSAFAGIAGLTSSGHTERVTKLLSSLLPNAKTESSHDGINVLFGAFPIEDGVSIICGTGSSCFVKRNGEIFRIGGYGGFDLIGNGYEIGKSCIAHALKTADGREVSGVMEELLSERIGSDDFVSYLDKFLQMSKDEIAALAPIVFSACEKGDKAAFAIIDDNMNYIAELINRASMYFESSCQVALAGGILKSSISMNLLLNKIPERVTLITNERPPVFGAAAYAKQLL
ncbi:MAG: hypothetical protein J6Q89_05110 [Clostridia bacterium]|nr:hypothetical protein [Clostridia bacterium]